jgi:hypothetical protein
MPVMPPFVTTSPRKKSVASLVSHEASDVNIRAIFGFGAALLVVAAVVHGELLALRPFTTANGLVARAVARTLVITRGLDPTGVAVPDIGWLEGGPASYIAMAAAYTSGTPDGVSTWIRYCANAFLVGVREGGLVADAVLAGRL